MIDEQKAALEWLDDWANAPWRCRGQSHALTLKAMLARPVMPEELSDELVEVIWHASYCPNGTHRKQAEQIVAALRAHLTAPKTKEVDVWHVEWAEQVNCFPPPESWEAECRAFRDREAADAFAKAHAGRPCIRVTGPHKQTVPA